MALTRGAAPSGLMFLVMPMSKVTNFVFSSDIAPISSPWLFPTSQKILDRILNYVFSFSSPGLMYSCKKQEMMRYKVTHCEQIQRLFKEQSQKVCEKGFVRNSIQIYICQEFYYSCFQLQRRCDGLIIIFDLDKYGMKHLWKPGQSLSKPNNFQLEHQNYLPQLSGLILWLFVVGFLFTLFTLIIYIIYIHLHDHSMLQPLKSTWAFSQCSRLIILKPSTDVMLSMVRLFFTLNIISSSDAMTLSFCGRRFPVFILTALFLTH